jgi:DHA1 family tetracycline resistance protein-like MFS transporter
MSVAVSRTRAHGRLSLIFIATTLCLDMLAQSISFPVLPRLTEELLGGDLPAAARWVGILEVAWAIPMFFAAPVLGLLSDRFGRRPIVVMSVFGVGIELLVGALAPNVWWLMAARILCGLTCGAQAAAMSYVADVTPPEERTKAYGWMNVAMWTGIVLGPPLAGLFALIDIRAPFVAAAAIAFVNGVFGYFVLPESLPSDRRAPFVWSKATPAGSIDLLLQRPGLWVLGVAMLFTWLAFQANDNMMVLYTLYRYEWSALTFGLFTIGLSLGSIAVQGWLAGRAAARFGERRTAIAGLTLHGIGMAAAGLAPSGVWYALANVPSVLGSIATPALQTLMTTKVAPDEQGRLQGAIGSISSFTSIVAPITFTQLFAWVIASSHAPQWSGITILIGAALSLVASALVFARAKERAADAAASA